MNMNGVFVSICLATLIGCGGPFTAPAIQRLDPDQQARVDGMWNNMLIKPDRLDRELLLDVLITFEMHQLGVDRATYHSEKDFANGVVLMDMKFDRQKPLDDWFLIEVRDRQGKPIRKERYSREEIWSHYKNLAGFQILASAATQPTSGPAATTQSNSPTADENLRDQWILARYRQIMAATQPVSQTP